MFLCKDKSLHCSPETSLQQLRLPRELGISNRSEMPSQLVFTIHPVMPSDSGTYQCCASSQNPDRKFQGHFFSVHVSGKFLRAPGATPWDREKGGCLET